MYCTDDNCEVMQAGNPALGMSPIPVELRDCSRQYGRRNLMDGIRRGTIEITPEIEKLEMMEKMANETDTIEEDMKAAFMNATTDANTTMPEQVEMAGDVVSEVDEQGNASANATLG